MVVVIELSNGRFKAFSKLQNGDYNEALGDTANAAVDALKVLINQSNPDVDYIDFENYQLIKDSKKVKGKSSMRF